MHTPLAEITATSLVLNLEEPGDLLRAPRRADSPDKGSAGRHVDFDIKRELGRKGTRSLDRAAGLAMHAVGRLPGFAVEPGVEQPGRADTGLVLATTMGSIQSTMDFTRDSFTGARPFHVDPARFPNTVMNFAAGQCAIRYRIQGPNATVTTGHVGSFTALAYAARLLRGGRASQVVVGASEELSPARARLELAWGTVESELGEGAAAVLVCPPGSAGEPLGSILRLDSALALEPESVGTVLHALCTRVLDSVSVAAGTRPRIRVLVPRDADPAGAEVRAVALALGDEAFARTRVIDVAAHTGDLGSASGIVQVQAALSALAAEGADGEQDCALVSGTDREGAVHVALVRIPVRTRSLS